ncbi:MAG: SPFH domain-containing protein [Bacilli bacterium]|jgi:regulator of protease activity HflC (stomatin/prohibitin superfamily)|nr:SPFH domain-containing protein [Bacillota bacterium]HOA78077.1 SPFH domain-containing protein [Bacilli bacterium]HQC89071.1 SPFH domain-containing protein [Bacilli bacterium]
MNLVMLFLSDGAIAALIIIVVLLLIIVISGFRIVPQANAYVVQRVGQYYKTWETGIHYLVPFIDKIAKKVSLKEQVLDFDPQPVITKDNVTMQIDTVVFFFITDPKAYTYGVDNPIFAIEKLTATTLRNIIGEIDLDQTLTSRDLINAKMRDILDEATDPWGIKVNRVELKNILPPKDIRDAMEKQMRAERERREAILRAEGEKSARILQAEGMKQSQILEAEGKKQAAILKAEGEAEAILRVQDATAQGLQMLKKAGADDSVLTLKAYEALKSMADGKATKIIIPSEIQGIAGLVTSMKEVLKDNKE